MFNVSINDKFQFHYGSIKSIENPVDKIQDFVFQFHYGSIKSRMPNKIPLSDMEFQFHYGSIKSKTMEKQIETCCLFQFHYGSIKSKKNLITFQLKMGFNSTMVRLKEFLINGNYMKNLVSIPLWFD